LIGQPRRLGDAISSPRCEDDLHGALQVYAMASRDEGWLDARFGADYRTDDFIVVRKRGPRFCLLTQPFERAGQSAFRTA
jgi:hypothetical protein